MTHFDVFNGDADGLCALAQLRLETPRPSTLVTGVKRDIELLRRVPAQAGDSVTVLDVSLAANRDALDALLARGASVEYFDHHYAGKLPSHPKLSAHIDVSPDTCTGLIVDRYLNGRRRPWAIVAAFGDELRLPARKLARALGLTAAQTAKLRLLGEALGYNAYADRESDLVAPPQALFRSMLACSDPFEFVVREPALATILAIAKDDLAQAARIEPSVSSRVATIYTLPDAVWSRRVRGRFAYMLARRDQERAHAVLVPDDLGGYTVSLRAPSARPIGADSVCRQFTTGGGRSAAAGINHLPTGEVPAFVAAVEARFTRGAQV
jgi:hypothetical protein